MAVLRYISMRPLPRDRIDHVLKLNSVKHPSGICAQATECWSGRQFCRKPELRLFIVWPVRVLRIAYACRGCSVDCRLGAQMFRTLACWPR
jgi:hypothetical protein